MNIMHTLKTDKYSKNVMVVDNKLLKKIQNRLLFMMKDIVTVLEKHNIK